MNNWLEKFDLEKYLTKKNIIIFSILIIVFIGSYWTWLYLQQGFIEVKSNNENVNIEVMSSNGHFVRERSPDYQDKLIKNAVNTDYLSIRVEPNKYYQVKISKNGFQDFKTSFWLGNYQKQIISPNMIGAILSKKIIFPVMDIDNTNIIFINNENKDTEQFHLSKYDINSKETKVINHDSWLGVEDVIYSPQRDKAILKVRNYQNIFAGDADKTTDKESWVKSVFYREELPDQIISTWAYDLTQNKYYFLGRFIKNINWLNNEKIIYEYNNLQGDYLNSDADYTDNLNLADFDGQNWKTILDLKNNNLINCKILPSPTDDNTVLLWQLPFSGGFEIKNSLMLLNISNNNLKNLHSGAIMNAKWSKNGKYLIFSEQDVNNAYKPIVKIFNIENEKITETNINTLINKLTEESGNIIYALPGVPDMPENYQKEGVPFNFKEDDLQNTFDRLFIFSQQDNTSNLILNDETIYFNNIHDIFASNNQIYFLDKNNHLFSIDKYDYLFKFPLN